MKQHERQNRVMEADTISKNGQSPKSHKSRENILKPIILFAILGLSVASCGSAKYVPVSVTPSNANISYSSGNRIGTGSGNVHFTKKDKKNSYHVLVVQAPDYRTQTARVYKSDNSRTFRLEKKVTTYVNVSVSPSNANIYHKNGNKAGTGSCILSFDEDESSNAYFELKLEAPDHRTQTVNVYKSDNSRSFTLVKKVKTNVNVSVSPSNAIIYYKNGNRVGTGNCVLSFEEDEPYSTHRELTLESPNYYTQTVRVYKSDNSKNFTLQPKPIKTVVVTPGNAEIRVNNELVGKGKYDISFENRDKVLLTFSAIGYETTELTLLKSNTEQTITYQLEKDEAYENSLGDESAAQYANKWVPITVRQGLTNDEVWLRMVSIVREHFEQIDKTDKSSGHIRTFYVITPYKTSDVRTRLEIRTSFSTGELQYQVQLQFEKGEKNCDENGWKRYDRLMKKYKDVIPDLLNSVGGGM